MVSMGIQMKRYLLVLFPVVLLAGLIPTKVYAQDDGDNIGVGASGSGGNCIIVNTIEEFVAPSSCEGEIQVWTRIFGHPLEDVDANQCVFLLSYIYDCDTGILQPVIFGEEGGLEAPSEIIAACETPGPSRPCGGVVWNNGITWTSEGPESTCSRWEWRLSVSASLPCNRIGISPYPATTVGWPTAFRFLGAGSSGDSAFLAYAGSGSPGNPVEGDQRNITLTLQITPAMNAVEMYIPGWGTPVDGGKQCPLQGVRLLPAGVTSLACWDLSSHPAAGGSDAAGNYFPGDPVAPDTPLFKGWGRVAYYATWSLSYDQYQQIGTQQVCEPPAEYVYDEDQGRYVPECTYGPDEKPGHIEEVPIYDWVSHSSSGLIDPDMVAGLPEWAKADLDGDGAPEAFWSYGLQVVRLGEPPNYPTYSPWFKEYVCRPFVPLVVREAQSRVAWPDGGYVHP